MKSKTPRVDRAWRKYQTNPHDESACPWGLASRMEVELRKVKSTNKNMSETQKQTDAGSQHGLMGLIVVQGLTNDVREVLKGARKWLLRIHKRKSELPKSFLDGCDPKPLSNEIGRLLAEPISQGHKITMPSNAPAGPQREGENNA